MFNRNLPLKVSFENIAQDMMVLLGAVASWKYANDAFYRNMNY